MLDVLLLPSAHKISKKNITMLRFSVNINKLVGKTRTEYHKKKPDNNTTL
jgi:hypothetical protein